MQEGERARVKANLLVRARTRMEILRNVEPWPLQIRLQLFFPLSLPHSVCVCCLGARRIRARLAFVREPRDFPGNFARDCRLLAMKRCRAVVRCWWADGFMGLLARGNINGIWRGECEG